jgi:signal transduction histidine kinase
MPSGVEADKGPQIAGRVLLVDDSALVRDFVGGLIADWGFEVETRASAKSAFEALASNHFDVIVADLNMPEISGLEMLTTLRMRSVETPVIILSSVSRTSDILRAIHRGAFDYVTKDEAIEPLRVAIVRAIEHARLVGENTRLLKELEHFNADLEDRVRERTSALEQANAQLLADRRELEATLARLAETQEQLVQMEKMASIGLLTAGVAHEINNPLGYILPSFELVEGWVASAREGKKDERVQSLDDLSELISDCRRGLDRIARLVRQLRVFSHPGRKDLGPVDVDAIVQSVVSMVERETIGRASVTVYSTHDCIARGNEDQLRQVLLNLLINSTQSFAADKTDGRIEVFAERKEEWVNIRVIDNGCGVAPEHLRRVFDPFFTTKPVGRGSGLGLSISRDLVQKMEGKLTLDSHLGRGTSATVALHAWRETPPEQQVVEPPRTPTPELLAPPPGTRRLRIIIIEDETALLQPLRRMLSGQHDVLTFSDPRDGMRRLLECEPPDVIICDVNMPEVSGLALYRQVTSARPFLAQRFLFLTGSGSSELPTLRAEAPGRILDKPVHRKELIAAIEAVSMAAVPEEGR